MSERGRADAATVGSAIAAMQRAFAAAGLETPGLDARRLAEHVLWVDAVTLVREPDRTIDAAAQARLDSATERRLAREPVSRIMGLRHFFGLELEITPATLDPRPETETLVEAALELAASGLVPGSLPPIAGDGGAAHILDLGTGSGAILVALLSRMANARGVGVDISADALACAARNLARHGLGHRAELCRGDWLAGIDGAFDMVVSNPPYIPAADIAGLDPEVARYDPVAALDGGRDGLAAYRALAASVGRVLVPGGWCLLEVGRGQSEAVLGLLAAVGLGAEASQRRVWRDLAGIYRCVAVRAHPMPKSGGGTGSIHAS